MTDQILVGQRTVVAELRSAFDRLYAASDSIDGKIQNIFGASGLLITIATIGQLAVLRDMIGMAFWIYLAVIMLLYVAMYITIFIGIRPRDFKLPISMEAKELVERYFDEEETDVIARLTVDYLEVMSIAQEINGAKARALNVALGFFVSIVIALLVGLAVGAQPVDSAAVSTQNPTPAASASP